jgi:phosphohistidine phosphatase
MKLLVIRHAIAETRDEFALSGRHDDLRPLTSEGRHRMRRVAAGLKALVPELPRLASSPLVRAQQTLEIVAEAYPAAATETLEALAPDQRLPPVLGWLRQHGGLGTVAVIGHEPHLSHLVSWLLAGRFRSFVELKKGAACLLEFGGEPAPGEADLHWLMQPGQLRRIVKRR